MFGGGIEPEKKTAVRRLFQLRRGERGQTCNTSALWHTHSWLAMCFSEARIILQSKKSKKKGGEGQVVAKSCSDVSHVWEK